MNWPKAALRSLGKRLPKTHGTMRIEGIEEPLVIRRDRFGVPHIEAANDSDAWFGVGFCQGQDRAFQIETRIRATRGTLAALIGEDGLPIDRLSRRIGFHRYGQRVVAALEPRLRRLTEAFAAGVRAGTRQGTPHRPHEFVLLRSHPSHFEAADVPAFLCLMSFVLSSNWDAELARLQILRHDGPGAVASLDPGYLEHHPSSDRPGEPAGAAAERLAGDLASLAATLGFGGGSNNWAISPRRTTTGRPILANDPHLAPLLPAHWHLVHVVTPDWAVAGAAFVGAPVVAAGHNGCAAWGVTAGHIDNTDLFLEEVGRDGVSVRRGGRYVPAQVRHETIHVRGGPSETLEVLETDRGPIVGPALDPDRAAISMAATWLEPRPEIGRMFDIPRVRSFDDLRRTFSAWNSLPLNVVLADRDGAIGWQMIGAAPRRRRGGGMIPLPAWEENSGWESAPIPFDEFPFVLNPDVGFVATANNLPSVREPYLGSDFLDGYRAQRIGELLISRDDWDVPAARRMQTDCLSIPWREMRAAVLGASAGDSGLAHATSLLENWDGTLTPDSAAATLFEVFVARLIRRTVEARAPRSSSWALGTGFHPLVPLNMFFARRVSHIAGLIVGQPDGWFEEGWPTAIAEALGFAASLLEERYGPDPTDWSWGIVRPLTLRHPMSTRKPLDRVFDLGPVPHGGDTNTINPGPVDPTDPLGNPDYSIASLRMVVDVGAWENSRFVLPGGQSGNPFSVHYRDQFALWRKGDAIPIPWSKTDVERATRTTLRLHPHTEPGTNRSTPQ